MGGGKKHRQSNKGRLNHGDTRLWHKRPVLRFFLIFCPVLGAFYLCWITPFFQNTLFPAYLRLNANASARVLALVGQDATSSDTYIHSKRFVLEIKRGCDALEPSAIFVAAVLAVPAPFRRKAAGVLAGSACLAVINVVRIVTLYFVGVYFPRIFHMVHVDAWQALFIMLTLVLWVVWARWAIPRGAVPANAPA
jgi:exosortase/archaeosortase family protein